MQRSSRARAQWSELTDAGSERGMMSMLVTCSLAIAEKVVDGGFLSSLHTGERALAAGAAVDNVEVVILCKRQQLPACSVGQGVSIGARPGIEVAHEHGQTHLPKFCQVKLDVLIQGPVELDLGGLWEVARGEEEGKRKEASNLKPAVVA